MSAERPGAPLWRRVLGALATMARAVCAVFALILVVYVLFTVGEANPRNWLSGRVAEWARSLTLGLNGLFEPANADLRALASYGVPALAWLVIGAVVGRLRHRG